MKLRSSLTRLSVVFVAGFSLFLCSCATKHSSEAGGDIQGPGEAVSSDVQRVTSPQVSSDDAVALCEDNERFAVKLYQKLKESAEGNLFYSPHSISIALAMTYAGARSSTADEMAAVMEFKLHADMLHAAFNDLDLRLLARNNEDFELCIVNQIWGRTGTVWVADFLDTLAMHYGAGLRVLDFARDPEQSRDRINGWVEDVTHDRIRNLLPEGSIDISTVLVLTNAIYFNAEWQSEFEEASTGYRPFVRRDGTRVNVPTMHRDGMYRYYAGSGYEAIEIPYKGDGMSLVAFVPEAGTLDAFETRFDTATVALALDSMERTSVALALPKFEFGASLSLKDNLQALGMSTAFTRAADFSGMCEGEGNGLLISDVVHKAFVKVDEKGTEAAAATGVGLVDVDTGVPDVILSIDRPFIFLILDKQTGALLFVGRVLDPSS